jgi:hypothetical protein
MTREASSWFGKVARLGRGDLGTQAAVLLPVIAIAGLTAWTMLTAPTSARSQTADEAGAKAMFVASQEASLQNDAPAQAAPDVASSPVQATPAGPPAVNGLKISSQSWRRGGLGSNALVTFTLRNDNNYAVKNIEIACAFSRQDGAHLTDRKRLIPDLAVNGKSRKTVAQMHVGYINVNANKAKCTLVTANRI